jgi:hypothetical protein
MSSGKTYLALLACLPLLPACQLDELDGRGSAGAALTGSCDAEDARRIDEGDATSGCLATQEVDLQEIEFRFITRDGLFVQGLWCSPS